MTRQETIRGAGRVILGANALLAVAKGAVWLMTGSLAVGSEAVNSAADAVYSLAVVGGLYLTTRPPDVEHPHGHERIEPFVSLVVALGVFAAGTLVFVRAGSTLLSGEYAVTTGLLGVGVLVASGAAKLLLYGYCVRTGRAVNSPALVAAGLDNRNDVFTAGAALVGVVGANLGYPVLDPLAAVVVSVGILYTGVDIVRDNLDYLVGGAPPPELQSEILRRALAHPDVRGAHDVVAHYVGPEIDVSLHVEVEGDMTLLDAHDIETTVAESIRDIAEIDDVFVHVDPKELDEWKDDEYASELLGR